MSGGSWNYCYQGIEDAATCLLEQKDPLRRAFGKHLQLVANAMHDIEWVDSHDMGPGDERKAIELVLGQNAKPAELEAVKADARNIIKQLEQLIS